MKPINLKEKLQQFSAHWHPHRIAEVDDMQVLLAKIKGPFVWHAHPEEDELFQVLQGTLYMRFRNRVETVRQGELIVVPKGVEHCPETRNDEEVHLLLFERKTTRHTGEVNSALTQNHYPEI
ncbi:cupin domain-containing protein [Robiginitalea sp. M366]|uniref:cupin domain-containing protein n=1 Tax=Robiginitalea aestuariiviva TaxID=3036903 RepID=UPI00240E6089|nr:cupin domain-containing protein [Robiginitalea aestuariiviva]MDG1571193.1 cupin domain-containing protein [Robiginitalea aestuariiviva]